MRTAVYCTAQIPLYSFGEPLMIKKTACILLLVSGSAFASDATLGFNNLSARYISSDVDGGSGDGYGLGLSFALTSYLFANFDYNTRSLDIGATNSDVEFFSGGLGGNYALNEDKTIQLFGTVSWEQVDISTSGGTTEPGTPPPAECDPTDPFQLGCIVPTSSTNAKNHVETGNGRHDGYGASLGVRALVWKALEVNAAYTYRDYDFGDETIYSVGTGYSYGNWATALRYESYDEFKLDELSLSVSYTFGQSEAGGESSIW
jgi:hypothetical protein